MYRRWVTSTVMIRPSPWSWPLPVRQQGVHEVRGDLAGGGAAAEDAVDAELLGGDGVEPRAARHQQRPPDARPDRGRERVVERRRELLGVVDVRVALRDDLGDQDGVGVVRL